MYKGIKWLKEELNHMHRMRGPDRNPDEWFISKTELLEALSQLNDPEVLSQEWISENAEYAYFDMLDGSGKLSSATAIIKPEKLKKLLVPKQEFPVIPKYVAEWIEDIKPDNSLRVAFEYIAQRKANDHDDKLALWVEEGNSETFARAWIDGYEVEKKPLYHALIKGHEVSNFYDIYWNYDKSDDGVFVSRLHPPHDNFINEMSKGDWNKLGINDSNADFKEVDEDD